jgi:hypothetical protein
MGYPKGKTISSRAVNLLAWQRLGCLRVDELMDKGAQHWFFVRVFFQQFAAESDDLGLLKATPEVHGVIHPTHLPA